MTRTLNAIAGLVLFVLVLPLLGLIAVLIRVIDSRGPIFVRQRRISQRGVAFRAWRFRTEPYPKGERGSLTRVVLATQMGACLRRYYLDGLPMLLNVMAGDLNLVEMTQ